MLNSIRVNLVQGESCYREILNGYNCQFGDRLGSLFDFECYLVHATLVEEHEYIDSTSGNQHTGLCVRLIRTITSISNGKSDIRIDELWIPIEKFEAIPLIPKLKDPDQNLEAAIDNFLATDLSSYELNVTWDSEPVFPELPTMNVEEVFDWSTVNIGKKDEDDEK